MLFFFFVLQLVGFSQPKNQPLAVVASTKMNIVYKYIPSPIAIAVPGYYAKDLVVKVNVGTIYKAYDEFIYYSNVKDTNEVTFSVFVKQKNKKLKFISSSRFTIKEIPKPIISFGSNYSSGVLPYENLQNVKSIFAFIDWNLIICGARFEVKEFKVKYLKTNGDSSVFQNNGMIINSEIKESFKKAEDEDTILIYDIIILGPSGKERSDHELLFIIKKS